MFIIVGVTGNFHKFVLVGIRVASANVEKGVPSGISKRCVDNYFI